MDAKLFNELESNLLNYLGREDEIMIKIPPHIQPVTDLEISRYWGKICLARMWLNLSRTGRP